MSAHFKHFTGYSYKDSPETGIPPNPSIESLRGFHKSLKHSGLIRCLRVAGILQRILKVVEIENETQNPT